MKRLSRIFALLMAVTMLIWIVPALATNKAEEEKIQHINKLQIEEPEKTEFADTETVAEDTQTHSTLYAGLVDHDVPITEAEIIVLKSADAAYAHYPLDTEHLRQAESTTPHTTLAGLWAHMRHNPGIYATVADDGTLKRHYELTALLTMLNAVQDTDTLEDIADKYAAEEFEATDLLLLQPRPGTILCARDVDTLPCISRDCCHSYCDDGRAGWHEDRAWFSGLLLQRRG